MLGKPSYAVSNLLKDHKIVKDESPCENELFVIKDSFEVLISKSHLSFFYQFIRKY